MTASSHGLERRVSTDGRRVFIDREEGERGDLAPFYAVYADPDGTDRRGFFCARCGSLDVAMDTMGRIECPGCGNSRLPTRWDAGYL